MVWVGFEPTNTEFRSDAQTDWAIRPWVQLALRANFVQLLQFHRLLSVTFHFGYLPSIHIFQIAVTNIISSIAGLCLKYNNQMVRNSKPAIACYENAILTLSNLKNLFFSSISFKMSINRSTCENTFFVIVHISS